MTNSEAPVPVDPLVQVVELASSGQPYAAFRTWFSVPEEARNGILEKKLRAASLRQPELSWAKNERSCPADERFVLSNFPALTSPVVREILYPHEGMEITERQVASLQTSVATNPGLSRFDNFVRERGIALNADNDYDDLPEPSRIFKSFPVEDMKTCIEGLTPFLPPEHSLFEFDTIIHPTKHADILTFPHLQPYVEEAVLSSVFPAHSFLENYLSQKVFPSAAFFEEMFKRRPDQTGPTDSVELPAEPGAPEIPMSAYFYTLLRRMTYLKESQTGAIKDTITGYLLSDPFMERALPYLDTDEVYGGNAGDYLVLIAHGIDYELNVEATGEEAKQLKRQRLGEVIKAAVDYARQKGDEETAQKLAEKEIGGLKYSDFIS